MPEEKKLYYCEKCGKTMAENQFYSSNNLEKYPNDGKFPQCKKCMTMHVDNWNPDTFLWILQEADVPWIPDEWNKLMDSYARNNKKITGTTIVGRYLSKMKLIQYKDYRWKDTEYLQERAHAKIEQTMKRLGYGAAEIQDAIDRNTYNTPDQVEIPQYPDQPPADDFSSPFGTTPSYQTAEDLGLTEEDQTYLLLKWGKSYKPEEWVIMEQLYNDMMNSYDIQGAGHEDILKLVCKTSLKCNQLIDIGDVEGYQKMSRVYDQLMKSGKFTAVQNKTEEGEFIDSIGELVMMCEKEGYIERYYVSDPQDKVDETLIDMKRYTKTLIGEEHDLSSMIEAAIQRNQREDEEERLHQDEDIITEDDLEDETLQDSDFEEFSEFLEEESNKDKEVD